MEKCEDTVFRQVDGKNWPKLIESECACVSQVMLFCYTHGVRGTEFGRTPVGENTGGWFHFGGSMSIMGDRNARWEERSMVSIDRTSGDCSVALVLDQD